MSALGDDRACVCALSVRNVSMNVVCRVERWEMVGAVMKSGMEASKEMGWNGKRWGERDSSEDAGMGRRDSAGGRGREEGEGDARRVRQSKDGEESELVKRGEEDEGWDA